MQGLLHWVNSALVFPPSRAEQRVIPVYAQIQRIPFFIAADSAYEISLLLALATWCAHEISLLLALATWYVSFPQK